MSTATATSDIYCNSRSSTSIGDSESKTSRQEWILSSLQDLQKSNTITEETEFSTNHYELDRHGRGESYHRGHLRADDGEAGHDGNSTDNQKIITPDVIVRPNTIEDVSTILAFCNENMIPVIPYGAGTSVEGHLCALKYGSISLDMNAFQSIVLPGEEALAATPEDGDDVLLPDPIAKVGAGVTRKTLNEALRHTGFQFVVDPGADASLGGMVATGASGTSTVRYGTIRDNILELECVLADGTHVERLGTKALKSSAGYDLIGLMCGSEVSAFECTQSKHRFWKHDGNCVYDGRTQWKHIHGSDSHLYFLISLLIIIDLMHNLLTRVRSGSSRLSPSNFIQFRSTWLLPSVSLIHWQTPRMP